MSNKLTFADAMFTAADVPNFDSKDRWDGSDVPSGPPFTPPPPNTVGSTSSDADDD